MRGCKRRERTTSVLLRRLQTAVAPWTLQPALGTHRATEGLGRNLSRRRGHGGEEEEQGVDDEGGQDAAAAATTGSVSCPPLRLEGIR